MLWALNHLLALENSPTVKPVSMGGGGGEKAVGGNDTLHARYLAHVVLSPVWILQLVKKLKNISTRQGAGSDFGCI
jgi:hypothetical protein